MKKKDKEKNKEKEINYAQGYGPGYAPGYAPSTDIKDMKIFSFDPPTLSLSLSLLLSLLRF